MAQTNNNWRDLVTDTTKHLVTDLDTNDMAHKPYFQGRVRLFGLSMGASASLVQDVAKVAKVVVTDPAKRKTIGQAILDRDRQVASDTACAAYRKPNPKAETSVADVAAFE